MYIKLISVVKAFLPAFTFLIKIYFKEQTDVISLLLLFF